MIGMEIILGIEIYLFFKLLKISLYGNYYCSYDLENKKYYVNRFKNSMN
jgi:hypothetical protein